MFDYKKSEIQAALDNLSIEYQDTIQEVTADSVYSLLCQKQPDSSEYFLNPSEVRDFLKELGLLNELKALHIHNKREKMVEYFYNNVAIDGRKCSGSPPAPPPQNDAHEPDHDVPPPNFDKTQLLDFDDAEVKYDQIKENLTQLSDEMVSVSASNRVYRGADITVKDQLSFWCESIRVNPSFCLLVNNEEKVVLFGTLIDCGDGYHSVEAKARNIRFDRILDNTSYHLIFEDAMEERFYSCEVAVTGENYAVRNRTLCIDFGTSNTTAGTYSESDGSPMLVEFEDVTTSDHKTRLLYPTLVYVKRCDSSRDPEDEGAIEFQFGYEAKKVLTESDYCPKGTFFHEIKNWISAPETLLEIQDEKHNQIKNVPAKVILRAYIRHIIRLAEEHFKETFEKFHFSAPIKLKSKFIDFVTKEVFPFAEHTNCTVMNASESIDEAIAIIYHFISSDIKTCFFDTNVKNIPPKQIMIIDCGGGTTDIATCCYDMNRIDSAVNLNITSRFENGNSEFGGNNITYRIFQLMKIKLAAYYHNSKKEKQLRVEIGDVIKERENEILTQIDSCVTNHKPITVYQTLDERAKECEKILPVDFNGSGKYALMEPAKSRTRRNFHFLWQLAEKIKLAFFNSSALVSIDFAKEDDKRIIVRSDSSLYFYILDEPNSLKLTKVDAVPDIEINTKELETLLRPDIYYQFASLFLKPDGRYIDFEGIDHVKLSGQSCKIPFFHDLLKEFIPGKKLRNTRGNNTWQESEKLKLDCIKGCILYTYDWDIHRIQSAPEPDTPNIIYRVENSHCAPPEIINGLKIKRRDDGTYLMPKIVVDTHEAREGNLNFTVFSVTGGQTMKNHVLRPLETRKGSEKEVTISNLLKQLAPLTLHHIEKKYYVDPEGQPDYVEGEELCPVFKQLESDLKMVPVEEGKDKYIVFALPNSDGYGFSWIQLRKHCEGSENKYFFIEKNLETFENIGKRKSFFNGCICEDGEGE